ncbi:MAG: flagellar FlbD family protein [Terriglobales bacterium]
MIALTRLNHQEMIVNSDLIKFIEQAHDTVITLTNNEKVTVEEAPAEIVRRIILYRRELAAGVGPAELPGGSGRGAGYGPQ